MCAISGGVDILKLKNVAKQVYLTKIVVRGQLSPKNTVSSIAHVPDERRLMRSMVGLFPEAESKLDWLSINQRVQGISTTLLTQ